MIIAVLLVLSGAPAAAQRATKDCTNDRTGLVPLTELVGGEYRGEAGGLYDGSNLPPDHHLQQGLAAAADVVPRGLDGSPASDGSIGLVSIGVSNTRTEFAAFERLVARDGRVNPALRTANLAQNGAPLGVWTSSSGRPWLQVDSLLDEAGLTAEQVQVAWVKLPAQDRGPSRFPREGERYVGQMVEVLQVLRERFPNLRLVYLSSRIYGGYADQGEPIAYENGFSVKWTIELQVEDAPELDPSSGLAPWIGWGPYMWADGMQPRADGLVWSCDDFQEGIHPVLSGEEKVGELLLAHFLTDPTATPWFYADGVTPETVPPVVTTDVAPASTVPATSAPETTVDAETTTTSRVETPSTTLGQAVPPDVPAPQSSSSAAVWLALAVIAGMVVGAGLWAISARRARGSSADRHPDH